MFLQVHRASGKNGAVQAAGWFLLERHIDDFSDARCDDALFGEDAVASAAIFLGRPSGWPWRPFAVRDGEGTVDGVTSHGWSPTHS